MQTTYSSGARTTGSGDRSSSQEWAEPDVDMKDVTPSQKEEALVEVLGGMHGGRGAFHVGVNGEQSHQF